MAKRTHYGTPPPQTKETRSVVFSLDTDGTRTHNHSGRRSRNHRNPRPPVQQVIQTRQGTETYIDGKLVNVMPGRPLTTEEKRYERSKKVAKHLNFESALHGAQYNAPISGRPTGVRVSQLQ